MNYDELETDSGNDIELNDGTIDIDDDVVGDSRPEQSGETSTSLGADVGDLTARLK